MVVVRKMLLVAFLMAIVSTFVVVLTFADPGDNVVLQWDDVAMQAVSASKLGPPMVSRANAIVHTCMFDAWACYDAVAVGTQYGGALRRPAAERTLANKNKAISYAAYRALVDLYPTQKPLFDSFMTGLGYDPNDATTDTTTPAGIGNVAAGAVISFRHADGSNQLGDLHPGAYTDYTGYVPLNAWDQINDPNHWQPLRVPDGHGNFNIQDYIAPFWGNVKPFALTSDSQFRPDPPYLYPSGRYIAQAEELIHISEKLTDQEKVIAEYWADGPRSVLPPGHWCLFGQFVSRRDHHSLDDDVKMFFALTNAIFDAGIVAWDAKRAYDSVRPITAIPFLKKGKPIRAWAGPYKGTRLIDGGDWRPYQAATFPTPPFPEYISGHSAFSAAGAEILKRFTGSDTFGNSVTIPAGSSFVEPGATPAKPVTLSWATFSEAADQAGISRRYGGIHFELGDLTARKLGRLVGAQAWDNAQTYINGTAH